MGCQQLVALAGIVIAISCLCYSTQDVKKNGGDSTKPEDGKHDKTVSIQSKSAETIYKQQDGKPDDKKVTKDFPQVEQKDITEHTEGYQTTKTWSVDKKQDETKFVPNQPKPNDDPILYNCYKTNHIPPKADDKKDKFPTKPLDEKDTIPSKPHPANPPECKSHVALLKQLQELLKDGTFSENIYEDYDPRPRKRPNGDNFSSHASVNVYMDGHNKCPADNTCARK